MIVGSADIETLAEDAATIAGEHQDVITTQEVLANTEDLVHQLEAAIELMPEGTSKSAAVEALARMRTEAANTTQLALQHSALLVLCASLASTLASNEDHAVTGTGLPKQPLLNCHLTDASDKQ